jgi:hypothetical protein
MDSTFMCKTLLERRSQNPSRIREKISGGTVRPAHRAIATRSAEAEELLGRVWGSLKFRRDSGFIRTGEIQGEELAEEKNKGRGL